jgi:sirohydrochlorin cobaltochelatase
VIAGFPDAALLLIGHGSSTNAESAAPLRQHAAELRRRGLFQSVHEAFWKQEPSIANVLSGLRAKHIFAVPVFISDGYFTEQIIPLELGLRGPDATSFERVQTRPGQVLAYCRPLGTHPSMADIILARAREAIDRAPFPRVPKLKETTLFVAGHGTDRNENSRRAIEEQVDQLRTRELFADVHAVFLEEEPRVGACFTLAGTRHLVMVPFFISDGQHSYEDIPVMLGEPERIVRERIRRGQPTWRNPTERNGKLLWYGRSVGTEPHLADVILERVQEAAAAARLR